MEQNLTGETACHLGIALCESFPGLLVARFFQGVGGSTFSTVVGGIIADMYQSKDRGFPMSLLALCALAGTGAGPMVCGFIAQYSTWRWIYWGQLIYNGFHMVLVAVLFQESRGGVVLSKKVKVLNRLLAAHCHALDAGSEKGSVMSAPRVLWKCRSDEENASLSALMSVSIIRPFKFLFTEPVVFAFSMWAAFTWAMVYM